MAHTIAWGPNGNTMSIVPDASSSSDVNFGTYFPKGAVITAIQFDPSAVNDVICITDGTAAGPPLLRQTDVTGGGIVVYPMAKVTPYVDISECTFDTAASAAIMITFRFRG